jgi:hypothetical protein
MRWSRLTSSATPTPTPTKRDLETGRVAPQFVDQGGDVVEDGSSAPLRLCWDDRPLVRLPRREGDDGSRNLRAADVDTDCAGGVGQDLFAA